MFQFPDCVAGVRGHFPPPHHQSLCERDPLLDLRVQRLCGAGLRLDVQALSRQGSTQLAQSLLSRLQSHSKLALLWGFLGPPTGILSFSEHTSTVSWSNHMANLNQVYLFGDKLLPTFLGRGSLIVVPVGSRHCGPGKMRGLVTLCNSEYLLPWHLLVAVSWDFPSRQLAFIFLFWQMSSHPHLGLGFSPLKVPWEPGAVCGATQASTCSIAAAFVGQCSRSALHSCPCGPPRCAACWSWLLASCLAYQPRTGSASCCVMDGSHGHAGSLVITQDDLCSKQQNKISEAVLWGKF